MSVSAVVVRNTRRGCTCSATGNAECTRIESSEGYVTCRVRRPGDSEHRFLLIPRVGEGRVPHLYRRRTGFVTASMMLIGKASASCTAGAAVLASYQVILPNPTSQLAFAPYRRRPHERLRGRGAFVARTDPPRRWARLHRPIGANAGSCRYEGTETSLRSESRYCVNRSGRRIRGEHRMISAGASGEALSGDFLHPDNPWTLRAPRQQGISAGKSWPESSSSGLEQNGSGVESGGARERALRRAANAVARGTASEEGTGSWTPRREGQGSWDKIRAKAAELAPPVWLVDIRRGVCSGDVRMSQPLGLDLAECNGGVCVSKVHSGGSAERQGVRVGDRIVATTATLGNILWDKNTVDGIMSAVGTRLVFTDTVTLRVERPLEPHQLENVRFTDSVAQSFEVTLKKPPGLILEQVTESSGNGDPVGVFVAGITPGSPADLCGEVERGDRVVAVTGSLGNHMWPHRRVEGVESAIDTRIGNTVTLRLERAAKKGTWDGPLVTKLAPSTLQAEGRQSTSMTAIAVAGSAAGAASTIEGTEDVQQQAGQHSHVVLLGRCEALIRSYGIRKQAIAVDKLLEQMAESGIQMTARFLNSALSAYLMCKEPQKAVDAFYAITGIVWPEPPPWPVQSRSRAKVSTRSVSNRKWKKAERMTLEGADSLKSIPMPRERAADDVCAEFPEEFIALMAGPVHLEDETRPLEMSTEEHGAMAGDRFLQVRESAETDEVSGWDMGTTVSSGEGNVDRGVTISPSLGPYVGRCRPNALLVTTVVKAHGRRRRLDEACRTVQRMEDWGLKPDVAVFNSLAAAAVWNGRLDLAIEIVLGGMMKAWGVEPNHLSYNTIMNAYARAGNVVNVEKIYDFMVAEGLTPDVVTTTTLVKAQVESGEVGVAMATLIEMLRMPHIKSDLDAFPFNTIIQGMMKTGMWERAMDMYETMAFHGIQPNVITFNSLITGLVRANKADLAVDVFVEMADYEVAPDTYTFSSLASAYAKLGDASSALETLSTMVKNGIKPNRFTCSSVMQACVRGDRPETALMVYDKLVGQGRLETDEVTETLVVQAMAMLRRFEDAFEVITAMGRAGKDDKVPFNHLLKECVLAGEWGAATEAVQRMLHQAKGGKGIRFDSKTFRALSTIPHNHDGTEAKAWPRITFLMDTKELMVERGWNYSSTLYLAILEECVSREDYDLAYSIMEDRKVGHVYVHKDDWSTVYAIEDKIFFKIERRAIEAFVRRY